MRFFMIVAGVLCAATLALWAPTADAAPKVDIFIYTEITQWIAQGQAQEQADIFMKEIKGKRGIGDVVNEDAKKIEAWTKKPTVDKGYHIISLYGDFPPEIYPQGNTQTDGSIAETFIETTDGDTFINHADYMFWGLAGRNREGGLQNMMDIDGIVMWDDDTPMKVTAEGTAISPTLTDYASDRPFHTDQLDGDWEIEVSLAQNDDGTRADPIIVRDGNLGRLIPAIQTANGDEPKGAIAAEIITYLMSMTPVEPVGKLSTTWGDLKAVR